MQQPGAMHELSSSRIRFMALGASLVALYGCGSQGDEADAERIDRVQSPVEGCDTADAGGGWVNHAVPQSTGVFSAIWSAYPSDHSIDTVMGFSNGPASSFTDLGPIVRFSPTTGVDLRDGSAYVPTGYGYTGGVGPFQFQLRVDVPAHRYSVWIRRYDALAKPFELLAQDLAFRTEQSEMPKVDDWGSFTDGASGSTTSCGFQRDPANGCFEAKADGVWVSRPFEQRISRDYATATVHAFVDTANVDAVIGVAKGIPTSFDQLAAIVRFRPDGRMDARRGGAYAADTELIYAPNTYYSIRLELDLQRRTYNVSVTATGTGTVPLARDYAFRTEQAAITDVDHVAQFVDGTLGALTTCATTTL